MAKRFSVEAVFKGVDRVTAPVSRMQQRMGRFTRSLSRGLRSVNRMAGKVAAGIRRGAAVAGVALAGLALSVNSVADEADDLAKRSRRLDFDIEGLQEWRFIAEQSGVSVSELDSNLDSMAKRMGEARAGSGRLYSHLKKTDEAFLNQLLSTSDLSEALEMLMDRASKIEDPMDRAALLSAAFSKQGLNMANVAEQGADSLEMLRKQARENGLITKEGAEAAETYNDAVNRLKRTWRGFMTGVLIPLMPTLTDLVDRTRDWLNSVKGEASESILKWFEDFANNIEVVLSWIKKIGIGVGIFIAFTTILKTLIGVLTVVNLLLAANPIVLIVLAVVALIAALAAAVYWWDEIKAVLIEFGQKVVGFWENLPGPVKKAVGLLMVPFKRIIQAVGWIKDNWRPLADFFSSLLGGIVDNIKSKIDWMLRQFERVKGAASKVGGFFGIGGDDDEDQEAQTGGSPPPVTSPQERTARSIEERRSTANLTIRDETGRAELDQRGSNGDVMFDVDPTGSFA